MDDSQVPETVNTNAGASPPTAFERRAVSRDVGGNRLIGGWSVRVEVSSLSDAWKAAVELSGADCCIGVLALDAPIRRGTIFSSGCSRSDLAHLDIEALRCWLEGNMEAHGLPSSGLHPVDAKEVADLARLPWLKNLDSLKVGVTSVPGEGMFWLLLGWRRDRQQAPDPHRQAVALRVLAQCAASHSAISRREKRLQILESVVDELAPAFMLINTEARVFWTNQQAEALLARRDFLIRNGGNMLASSTATRTAMLREAITDVARQHRVDGNCNDRYLLLPRETTGDDVVALRAVVGRESLEGNRAVLVIVPNDQTPELARRLVELFGLIPSEARFVSALVKTGSPAVAAERLGITPQTAKTYLKRIYSKLGISNQLELAMLLSSITPPLRARTQAIGSRHLVEMN